MLSGWHCCLASSVTAIQMPINTVNEVHNSLVVSDKMMASRTLRSSRFHSNHTIVRGNADNCEKRLETKEKLVLSVRDHMLDLQISNLLETMKSEF